LFLIGVAMLPSPDSVPLELPPARPRRARLKSHHAGRALPD
jgi:hypothetical protein